MIESAPKSIRCAGFTPEFPKGDFRKARYTETSL